MGEGRMKKDTGRPQKLTLFFCFVLAFCFVLFYHFLFLHDPFTEEEGC